MRHLGAGGAGFIGSNLIFIGQALQEQPLALCGTGEQARSFSYRSDQVNALQVLMNSDVKGSKRAELLLGWRPVVDLAEGLQATISHLSSELRQPEPQLV